MAKQSKTEEALGRALRAIGLYPLEQYKISNMSVDFAFPEDKVVVEVDGPHHLTEEQKKADCERDSYLQKEGWHVLRLFSSDVFENNLKAAYKVKYFLEAIVRNNNKNVVIKEVPKEIVKEVIKEVPKIIIKRPKRRKTRTTRGKSSPKKRVKKYKCLGCGKRINHKGRCLPCNIRRKKQQERERRLEEQRITQKKFRFLREKEKEKRKAIEKQKETNRKSRNKKILTFMGLVFIIIFVVIASSFLMQYFKDNLAEKFEKLDCGMGTAQVVEIFGEDEALKNLREAVGWGFDYDDTSGSASYEEEEFRVSIEISNQKNGGISTINRAILWENNIVIDSFDCD